MQNATPIAPLSKARRFIKSLVMEHSSKRFSSVSIVRSWTRQIKQPLARGTRGDERDHPFSPQPHTSLSGGLQATKMSHQLLVVLF
jgi:hypothetical protein